MKTSILFASLMILATNAFSAEVPSCRATFLATAKTVPLKLDADGTYSAKSSGYDFLAFIDKSQNSINMAITRPKNAKGDRETVSAGQVKPTVAQGTVSLYITNEKEQIALLCRVSKKQELKMETFIVYTTLERAIKKALAKVECPQ